MLKIKTGRKSPNDSQNYHDEIDLKELIKGTHNDTEHQNNAHQTKQSYRLWWGAADQYTMLHGTYIKI